MADARVMFPFEMYEAGQCPSELNPGSLRGASNWAGGIFVPSSAPKEEPTASPAPLSAWENKDLKLT